MKTFDIVLHASKAGSIGQKYNIRRDYKIIAADRETAQAYARQKAYDEGLEHTLITHTKENPDG